MAQDTIEWTVHPIRRHPGRGALLFAVILAVEYLLVFVWASPYLAVLAAFLLLAATGRFVFPTHFRMDAQGVEATFLGSRRRRAWKGLRRMREAREGLLLSPFPRRSVLDEPRGVFLMYGGDERLKEDVLAFARRHLPAGGPPQDREAHDTDG